MIEGHDSVTPGAAGELPVAQLSCVEQFHCFDDGTVTVSGSPLIRVLSVSGLGSEKNPSSDPKIAF